MNKCLCKEWHENIDKMLMAGFLWAHEIEYDGVLMKYCPWCGKKLIIEEKEELEQV